MRGWLSILSVTLILAADGAWAHRGEGISGGFVFRGGGGFVHRGAVPGPVGVPSRLDVPRLRFTRTVPSLSPTISPLICCERQATIPARHTLRSPAIRLVEFGKGDLVEFGKGDAAMRATRRSAFRIIDFSDPTSFTGTGTPVKIVDFVSVRGD